MWQEPKNVKGSFTASLVVDAPFNIQSEPYIIEATAVVESTWKNLLLRIIILSAVVAGMVILAFRKKAAQKTE